MFESIRNFFNRLFGWNTEPEEIGLEDAGSLAEAGEDVVISEMNDEEATSLTVEYKNTRGLNPAELDFDTIAITSPKYLWCLDNGHGNQQPGKRSPVWSDGKQLLEWKFNREIVNRIIKRLDNMGIQYFNVIPEDHVDQAGDRNKSFLRTRVERANNKSTNLKKIFVSVHANAFNNSSVKGIETFHYPNATGRKLASIFHKHIYNSLKDNGGHDWRDRRVKTFANPKKSFYVLQHTKMPAVLTENGFYTNEPECRELMKEDVKDIIADAHVAAILEIEMNGSI